jgi:hypothetical protein
MLTSDEDSEIARLATQGWSISAIARHIGRDRKTVRASLHSNPPATASAPDRMPSSPSSPTLVRALPMMRACPPPLCTRSWSREASHRATQR